MLKQTLKALFTAIACAATLAAHAELPVLKVGATPTAVPFNFLDPKTNTLKGVMIDVAEAVGNEVGFKADVVAVPFASLVPALQTNKISLISSAFARTPARAEVVDFSDVVVEYGESLIVPSKDMTPYQRFADLKGKVVGVQIGTAYVEPLKAVSGLKELKMYETMADMMRDISLGRLDAAFGDGPVLAYQLQASGSKEVRIVTTYRSVVPTRIALAVRKGDADSLRKINAAIVTLKANGALDGILKKWGVAS
jgi:polar amino acid transport system substrate-binding protein